MDSFGVNINGQRINYAHVLGYKKQNSKLLLINSHGGLALEGEEAGIYIKFKDESRLDRFIDYLDAALRIEDFAQIERLKTD